MLTANTWDRDANQVFRSIYVKGIALLNSVEDQQILHNDPSPDPSGNQRPEAHTTPRTVKPVSEVITFCKLRILESL